MNLATLPFSAGHAVTVVSWPVSQSEVMAWTGRSDLYPVSPAELLHWQADSDIYPVTGHLDGELVAYSELWVDQVEDEIELARIIVHPDCRNRGIGRAFVKLLVNRAAGFELSATVIRVSPENGRAIRCYEAVGFTRMSAEEQATFNRQQPREYVWLHFVE